MIKKKLEQVEPGPLLSRCNFVLLIRTCHPFYQVNSVMLWLDIMNNP